MSRLPIVCGDTDAPLDLPDTLEDPIPLAAKGQAGYPGWLADKDGRQLRYLRLSVTDRCDLRCQYCMPAEGVPASDREEVMSFEEIVRVVRVFSDLGIKTVRLTGGEPLVRRNVTDLVRRIRDEAGIQDIAMTTNATVLARHAEQLVQSGLTRVNVSLDTVDPETFAKMTRGGDLARVMDGIQAIQDAGIGEIKTNSVVIRGHNEHQVADVVQWAWDHGVTPRFIELMPLGEAAKMGRNAVVPMAEVRRSLEALIVPEDDQAYRADRGPAGYLQSRADSSKIVGFIGAVTDNFCHRCNRVRVTARGEIRACLASPQGLSLRDLMRQGNDDEAVKEAVEMSLFGKRAGHEFFTPGAARHYDVNMSQIGG